MALGARAQSVLKMILRQGAVIVAVGLVLGIVLALGMARLVGDFLSGVSPFDPLTYVSVSLSLALVALLASYIPALRATRVDPMVALRYE
jgi:putative ABC transport system permease protein